MYSFRVNRSSFLDVLGVGSSLSTSKSVLPILEYVCISLDSVHSSMVVSSSDGESFVRRRMSLDGVIDSSFSFCVIAHSLLRALSSLRDDVVDCVYDANDNSFILRHSKGEIVCPTLNSDEMPSVPSSDVLSGMSVSLPCSLLREWCGVGMAFASNDTLRPILNGLFIECDSERGMVSCCASDGHRLFHDSVHVDNLVNTFSFLIPRSALSLLPSILGKYEHCVVEVSRNALTFKCPDLRYIVRSVDGAYPPYRNIIPTSHVRRDVLSRADFLDSVSRIALFAPSTSVGVLSFDNSCVRISCDDYDFSRKAHETIDITSCENGGSSLRIGFNTNNLLSCLKYVRSETCIIETNKESTPIVLFEGGDSNRLFIVMPCIIV